MTETSLSIEDRGPVRILTMTGRPKRGNPLSAALTRALHDAVLAAERDPEVRVMVLAGTESYFSVGADLTEVHELSATQAVLDDWLAEFDRIAQARKPLIAAVRGVALGGGFELALTCDMIVCASDAKLGLPETGIGVIAGQGGTQRLLQLAGRSVATDLILTGRNLSGAEALAMGIVARSCPADQVLDQAVAVAEAIAARSQVAVRFAREVLREAADHPIRQSLKVERLLASLVLDSQECRDGIGEFLARKSAGAKA
ncbi:enoyl-CoA hydratase/isomerase family protein [Arvimicrobium flavum]|uniref:enoyl-CoA hydratase/isomerase family protein n=1 Tax=Arvimicrobium flavum TaxID=3393320 RepID=UPI00237BCA58|nr:enoyl-CoA hydratase/isomerase family protein [Mesorhizobium shangrilense]